MFSFEVATRVINSLHGKSSRVLRLSTEDESEKVEYDWLSCRFFVPKYQDSERLGIFNELCAIVASSSP